MFNIADPIPTDLRLIPDLLKEVEQTRLLMQKETDAVKAYETALKNAVIDNLQTDQAGVFGRLYKVQVMSKAVPKVDKDSWGVFFSYVQRSGRFDLLQRRLADSAVTEMLDAGHDIPGVSSLIVKSVSLTKV